LKLLTVLILTIIIQGCGGSNSAATYITAGKDCDILYNEINPSGLMGLDPLLNDQWYLKNNGQFGGLIKEDIRATEAWKYSKGQGVVVGVIDVAIEILHPDLIGNIVPGSTSFRPNNPSGMPIPCFASYESHGTAVAGIILGQGNNSIGISGVAPEASLIAYDTLTTSMDQDVYQSLVKDNQVISVYNNSWGSPDTGAANPSGNLFDQAIRLGLEKGRNGLGSIFVFSGGNGGPFDNSNLDGFVNKRGIITVCAINDQGRKTARSEPGANILVCGYGEGVNKNITTLGLNGTYRDNFSGSSAAAPQVSGVIALMLAARPKDLPGLNWRDVQTILAKTARKNDPTDSQWRAAGKYGYVHPYYGYGVVDAEAAVTLAKEFTSVGNNQKICGSELQTVNQEIPDMITGQPLIAKVNLDCPEMNEIEFVEIEVSTIHSSHGDLRIDLTSARGNSSRLMNSRTCAQKTADPCGSLNGWKFGSVHHMGESVSGTWTLTILDQRLYNTGILKSWKLTVYGR